MVYQDTWKYLATRRVKHLFFSSSPTVPVCGYLLTYTNDNWSDDERGLIDRRKCKTCVKYGE